MLGMMDGNRKYRVTDIVQCNAVSVGPSTNLVECLGNLININY